MRKLLLVTVLIFVSGCPAEPVDHSGFDMYKYYYKIVFTEGNQCTYPLFIRLNEMKFIVDNNPLQYVNFVGVNIEGHINPSDCSLVMFWNSYNSDPEKLPVEIYVRSLVTNSEAYFEGELDVLDSSNTQECILKDDHWTDKALSLCFESLPENAVIELKQESLIDWEDVYEESCTDYVSGQ